MIEQEEFLEKTVSLEQKINDFINQSKELIEGKYPVDQLKTISAELKMAGNNLISRAGKELRDAENYIQDIKKNILAMQMDLADAEKDRKNKSYQLKCIKEAQKTLISSVSDLKQQTEYSEGS